MAYKSGNTSGDWNTIMEPPSAADAIDGKRPLYPYNNATQTESGHSFEMDDTPDRERIRIHHRANTFIEMHPNGDEVHKIYGDGYEIILKNKKVSVKGSCSVFIDGNAAIQVKGDSYSTVEGNYTGIVNGNSNLTCKSNLNITANKEMRLSSNEDIEISCKSLNVTGDVYVQGDLATERTISAQGNITSDLCVIGTMSIRSPGSLMVGATALVWPTAAIGFIDIDVPMFINVLAGGFVNIDAGAYFNMLAGDAMTLEAGGFINQTAGGVFSMESGALMSLVAGGAITGTAAASILLTAPIVTHASATSLMTGLLNVVGLTSSMDFLALDTMELFSAHIHGNGNWGSPTTPPIPGT